jgi:hypothetical protein
MLYEGAMSSAETVETFVQVAPSTPVRTRSVEGYAQRIAPWVAVAASIWFALAAAWGLFGPLPAGHYGTMGGEGIIGENMVRWRILGPVWGYVNSPPLPSAYYCHHPWGGFWIQAIISAIFGHQDFALRLPAVLMSAATPPLLYGIARDAWGKIAGAAAAVGFVFLPITLGFANFHNVEVTVLFACALFFWGHSRMLTTWKRRHLVASLAGAALAACSDWPAYIMVGTFLGISLVRGFLVPASWRTPRSVRLYATWWALSVTLSVALLVMWIALFVRSDKLMDWLSSAMTRGGGSTATLRDTLNARKQWIEISFTPFVIFLGKIAAPLAILRLIWKRRDEEAYSLSILAGATASYVLFKQAADVHIFWSQYFGGYFALAFAQIVATSGDVGRSMGRFFKMTRVAILSDLVPLTMTVLFALLMLPDALRTLRYARETGGRFNEHGLPLPSETNLIYLLKRLKERLPAGTAPDTVQLPWLWNYAWASAAEARVLPAPLMEHAPPGDPHPIFLARVTNLTLEQQKALVATFHVEVYDDEFWVVDRRDPQKPIDAYSLEEREPSIWEWYFIGGVEPIRRYVRDPFASWEWGTHLGQAIAPPETAPKTREQIRIAHNIAVAAGDTAAAARQWTELERDLVRVPAAEFSEGISLLGFHRVKGTQPRIVLLLRATRTLPSDATFTVRAVVEGRRWLSLIPPDTAVRQVSVPAGLSSRLHRPGFLYSHTVVLRQRIGVERFWGSFESRDGAPPPVRMDGLLETPLLVAN